MNRNKKRKLEAGGWRVGNASEFLDLTPLESALVEIRLRLASAVREHRAKNHLTQGDLAARLGSSQSRVAKMEAGDSSVSMDLLMRALLALGRTPRQLASVIDGRHVARE